MYQGPCFVCTVYVLVLGFAKTHTFCKSNIIRVWTDVISFRFVEQGITIALSALPKRKKYSKNKETRAVCVRDLAISKLSKCNMKESSYAAHLQSTVNYHLLSSGW